MVETTMKQCDRCGNFTDKIFSIDYVDECGDNQTKNLCGRCDWDIMNGRGKPDDNSFDVNEDHAWEDYEYDPIYYPHPNNLR